MPPFSLLLKPTSADCNLRCDYCFYLGKASLYAEGSRHRMADAVLERVVSAYLATPQPQHSFVWQGGEPTLMGRSFFERVTELQQRYRAPGSKVANAVQTNGLGVTDALARHLGQHGFLVGVSVDGPAGLHDAHRVDVAGGGTHARAMGGIEVLRRHGVPFNVLTVVHSDNAAHAERIYAHHRESGFFHQQYLPAVDGGAASLSGEAWGAFLCALFDAWHPGDVTRISIRTFDALLARFAHGVAIDCAMAETCGTTLVVEHNGDVYPCDFAVEPAEKLGNIMTDSWEALLPRAASFGHRKATPIRTCAECPWSWLCRGGCPRDRPDIDAPTRLCEGWKCFFAHALPRLTALADRVPGRRGKNDPCPCGSGRKFKHCHAGPTPTR